MVVLYEVANSQTYKQINKSENIPSLGDVFKSTEAGAAGSCDLLIAPVKAAVNQQLPAKDSSNFGRPHTVSCLAPCNTRAHRTCNGDAND